jgi:hypothetical protein
VPPSRHLQGTPHDLPRQFKTASPGKADKHYQIDPFQRINYPEIIEGAQAAWRDVALGIGAVIQVLAWQQGGILRVYGDTPEKTLVK